MSHLAPAVANRCAEFAECFLGGFDDWKQEVSPRGRVFASARTKSSFVRDAIVQRVREKFDGVKGIGFANRKGMFCVSINREALVRLKKFNYKMQPQNILTGNIKDFFSDSLFGFSVVLARVVIGYRLNLDQTEIRSVDVTVYEGQRIVDVVNIYTADGEDEGLGLFKSRQDSNTESMAAVARRVKPRDGRAVEGQGQGEK